MPSADLVLFIALPRRIFNCTAIAILSHTAPRPLQTMSDAVGRHGKKRLKRSPGARALFQREREVVKWENSYTPFCPPPRPSYNLRLTVAHRYPGKTLNVAEKNLTS